LLAHIGALAPGPALDLAATVVSAVDELADAPVLQRDRPTGLPAPASALNSAKCRRQPRDRNHGPVALSVRPGDQSRQAG
jgi:hypothetical protein